MISIISEQKRNTIREALDRGEVHLLLDARQPGVAVPRELGLTANLVLKFSVRYGTALEITDWGISQALSFEGETSDVRVPWSAVFGAQCNAVGQRWVWPAPEDPPITTPARRGGLRLVN